MRGTQPAEVASEASGVPTGIVRKALLVTFAAIVLYGGAVAFADFRAVRDSLQGVRLETILLALALATASFCIRFLRWQGYLRALDVRISATDSALIFASGLGLSATPGKAGELLKSLMLQRVAATPIAHGVPIVAVERLTDAMSLGLLGAVGLAGTARGPLLVGLAVIGCLVLAGLLGSRRFGEAAIALVSRASFVRPHRARLAAAHHSVLRLCAPSTMSQALALALLAWTIHSLCLLYLANAFDAVSLTPGQAMFANAAPLLAGALAMLPGGLGLTEASLAGALIAFGDGAVTPALATAITLLVRLVTLWWAVGLGSAALGLWQLRRYSARARGVEN